MHAFNIIWKALRSLYEELFVYVPLSILWWLCFLVVIPLPPAIAGLVYLSNEIAHERRIEWRMAVDGAKQYFWQSWRLFLVSALITGLISLNIWFYLSRFTGLIQMLTILWLYVLILWLMAQIYAFPLMIAMERPTIITIYRNALLLTLASPLFTLILWLLLLVLTAISVVVPILLILITPGLWALASTFALTHLLEMVQRIHQEKAERRPDQHDKEPDDEDKNHP